MRPPVHPLGAATIRLGGEELLLLPSGAAFMAREATLLVTDLHLETGSSHARRGGLMPPHDTFATLARLAADVAAVGAERIVSLGDAFHDPFGVERLPEEARAQIDALMTGRDWLWIDGNHEAGSSARLGGRRAEEARLGGLVFRHEPKRRPEAETLGEVAGHLHPAARVKVAAGTVRRRCFATDRQRLILPAYGAYTGGLDVARPAFDGLFVRRELEVHLLGEGRVHSFPSSAIVGVGLSRGGTAPHRASR